MDNNDYQKGYVAGWLAASRSLYEAMGPQTGPSLPMAGNLPGGVKRRRGRPPKSSLPQPTAAEAPKRRRGRPRKVA